MTESIKSVVVVGGGMAGASAAVGLREQGFSGHITLIGAEEHLPYERPPLSKDFLGGTTTTDRLLIQPPNTYQDLEIEVLLGRPAVRLCRAERAVEIVGGDRVPADRVVLCMGVRPRQLDVAGNALPGVQYLHDIEDARAIQAQIERGQPVVVVGEGFVGTEVASTLAGLGADVTLLMAGDLPVPVLGTDASRWLLDRHRSHGVDIRPRAPLRAICGDRHVTAVELCDGTRLPAGAVVVGIGSLPAIELATHAGITAEDGIVVDGSGRTSVPEVYAAGDLARFPSPTFGHSIRVEHWQNAHSHAAHIAAALLYEGNQHDEPYDEIPWAWTDQYGSRWEIAGLPGPGLDVIRRGSPDSPAGALWVFSSEGRVRGAVASSEGRVRGAVATNRRRDLRAIQRALGRGPVFVTDMVADESVDMATALSEVGVTESTDTATNVNDETKGASDGLA